MEKHLTFNEYVETDVDIERKKRLLKKLNITNESLTVDDIYSVMEKLKLSQIEISKEKAQLIFDELDHNKKGKIKSADFIEQIIGNKKLESNEELNMFMDQVNESLITKSERVIEKLKKIKNKAWLAGDNESQDEIDWIITVISEQDLHEPEYVALNTARGEGGNDALEYIIQYSQLEEAKRRENDMLVINNQKTSTMSIRSSIMFFNVTEKEFHPTTKEPTFKRRNTRLSTFVSPSILAKVSTHLANISTFDFNIFHLNDLVERKTTFYIAYEIFTLKQFIDVGMVEEDNYKNFLTEIIDGYDRKNPYHNDLHGGDVMQTMYNIIEQGDLQSV